MMRALYAGISGLKNHQTKMDVIGNNIANVNTTGFKGSSVTFQDMLSQTVQGASAASGGLGGTNPVQVGMGMGVASINTNFGDGSLQATGKQTDLAISGQGFFVLSDGKNQVYTRAGGFDFDTNGNLLVPGTGYKVMGYKADGNGVVDANTLQAIQIPVGTSMAAKISSTITYANNLMSSATAIAAASTAIIPSQTAVTDTTATETAINTVGTGVAAVVAADPATTAALTQAVADALTASTKAKTDATNYQTAAAGVIAIPSTSTTAAASDLAKIASTSAQIAASKAADLVTLATGISSLAGATLTAIKGVQTLANTAVTSTASAVTKATATTDKTSDALASIDVYDSQGNAYPLSGTFEKTSDNTWSFTPAATVKNAAGAVIANVTSSAPITITFNADGTFKQSTTAATIKIDQTGITPASPYSGAGIFSITPDFSTMTQYGIATTVQATGQNGYTSGTLSKTSINTSGIVVGQFDNGQSLNLAQVALANFNNPSGLGKSGESLFVKTTNSGEPQVGAAGTGGRGTFNSGSLEMSNVDLAQQFSDMIVTQRGFQANSKIITTVDTMLEELVNLKR